MTDSSTANNGNVVAAAFTGPDRGRIGNQPIIDGTLAVETGQSVNGAGVDTSQSQLQGRIVDPLYYELNDAQCKTLQTTLRRRLKVHVSAAADADPSINNKKIIMSNQALVPKQEDFSGILGTISSAMNNAALSEEAKHDAVLELSTAEVIRQLFQYTTVNDNVTMQGLTSVMHKAMIPLKTVFAKNDKVLMIPDNMLRDIQERIASTLQRDFGKIARQSEHPTV